MDKICSLIPLLSLNCIFTICKVAFWKPEKNRLLHFLHADDMDFVHLFPSDDKLVHKQC